MDNKDLKSYSDSYFYKQYPKYQKILLDVLMNDPIIDKNTDEFNTNVIGTLKHQRIEEPLIRILKSTNTVLLDCDAPLPRSFKVFCAKEMKGKDRGKVKAFIDTSTCIVKLSNGIDYDINSLALTSYLINAGVSMIYHKKFDIFLRRTNLLLLLTTCFAKTFTHIIDYLAKISIQESNKNKLMYLAAMYFLKGIVQYDDDKRCRDYAIRIGNVSPNEANILDILIEKSAKGRKHSAKDFIDPYDNIKVFVNSMRDTLHLNDKTVTLDLVVEKWMMQYGPGTVFGMEYFPAFSAMITDAYVGGYLNNQKTIEKICGKDMVEYTKDVISTLGTIA